LFARLKNLLTGGGQGSGGLVPGGSVEVSGERRVRASNGLGEFFASLHERGGLNVLDLAGASQENISFITSMGHRLSSEDFVRALELTFGPHDLLERQSDPVLLDQFVAENLNFPPDHFDGALVWDALQFLSPHLLQLTVDRLHETLRPGSCLLAFLYADDKARQVPLFHYRIAGSNALGLIPRGQRPAAQYFNNRAVEKLFHRFASVKFFLAKDGLREIIVRR
jgi:hypothetical protein